MRNTQKGFTLVELIVVITILAILGTIAFISLQGYSQDAKNAKVGSDLSTMSTAVEVALTDGTIDGITNIVTPVAALNTAHGVTGTFGGGIDLTDATAEYEVGTINFGGLRQNGADFKDNDQNDYIAAVVTRPAPTSTDETFAFYQIAGETKDATGAYKAVVKGNYVPVAAGDVTGLISENGGTLGLKNNDPIVNTSMYD